MSSLLPRSQTPNTPVEVIVAVVARAYELAPWELISSTKERRVCMPRQVAVYLASRMTPLSLKQIARRIGGQHHTTLMHSCQRVEDEMKKHPKIKQWIQELIERVIAVAPESFPSEEKPVHLGPVSYPDLSGEWNI